MINEVAYPPKPWTIGQEHVVGLVTKVYVGNDVWKNKSAGHHERRIGELEDYVAKQTFANAADAKSFENYLLGDIVKIKGRPSHYEVVETEGTDDGGAYLDVDDSSFQLKALFEQGVFIEQWGVLFDDSTDNTTQIQRCVNFCANNGLTEIECPSGVARYSKLWFSYHPTENPDFPNAVRSGWALKIKGKGRLYTEPVADIETEIALGLGTYFRSTETTEVPNNAIVDNTSTIQSGLQFEDIAFVADTPNWVFRGSANPSSKLFNNVSFHNKHVDGYGVLVEDMWISTWGDVLIAGQDTTGTQTGDGLVLRNRLFAGGGMWNFGNINIRGFKNSGTFGYMTDPAIPVKLLDSIVAGVIQARNSENGLKLGGKIRSAVISGYHTEGCTVTGMQIAAEAGSVLLLGSYWDCALCSNASLVLGNGSGVAGANLDERTWSEVELRGFNFIDTHKAAIKIADGNFGENLVLASGKIGKVNGDGDLGIDFDNFSGNIRMSNVRYVGLTANTANRPNAVSYVDEGNFECYRASLIGYQKKSTNVESLAATKFLTAEDVENQFLAPDATNSRAVLPNPSFNRSFKFKNTDATYSLNIRDSANATTLHTVAPTESIEAISDGSTWYFI